MIIELEEAGLIVHSEIPVPVKYKTRHIDDEGYRMDLLVNDTVVVELKSVVGWDKRSNPSYVLLA